MSFKYVIFVLGVVLLIFGFVQVELFWSDFSLSYLQGLEYEVGDLDWQVLMVEYVSGFNWGDNFFFLDYIISDDDSFDNYFEFVFCLSLFYVSGSKLGVSIFKDFFVVLQWEGGQFNNYMYGVGISLDLLGFKYFYVNIYQVKNDLWDDDEQFLILWGVLFIIVGVVFLYDGFLDYLSLFDMNVIEMNFIFQFKWNVGQFIGSKVSFYIGMEYVYWMNKYGIDGVDEKNFCLLVKWYF